MKLFRKFGVTATYLLVPFLIAFIFKSKIENYLSEYLLINCKKVTTGKVSNLRVVEELMENDEMHEYGTIKFYEGTLEFITGKNILIKDTIEIEYDQLQNSRNFEVEVAYIENNPKIFALERFSKLPTLTQWYWKKGSIIILLSIIMVASIVYAFYKGFFAKDERPSR